MKVTFLISIVLSTFSTELVAQEAKKQEELFSMKVVEDGFNMSFSETERKSNYSIAKVSHQEGGSVASSTFIMRGFYKIAKLRECEYFFKAREWEDDSGDWIYKVYFFSDKDIRLEKLLGEDYSEEAQELFDELGYFAVKELDIFFVRTNDSQKNR